ncbi:MAG: leucine-rich repeat protein [Oscillospiraceae bacterium]|nr:leucine-rich repeat protein [Oscillospiraceae bacterium]
MKKKLTAIATAAAMLLSMVPMTGAAETEDPLSDMESRLNTYYDFPLINYKYDPEYYDTFEQGGFVYFINKDNHDKYILGGITDTEAESLTIPQEVNGVPVTIGWADAPSMHAELPNLKEINIEGDRLGWRYSIDGVLFRDATLMYYPPLKEGDYTIPEGTKAIDQTAFWYTQKLGKVTACKSLYRIGEFVRSSITEFDGTAMWGDDMSPVFAECPNLKTVKLNGYLKDPMFKDLPELESIEFTPEALVMDSFGIAGCPKLTELNIPQGSGSGALMVKNCENLQKLSFYNNFLGMSDVTWMETVLGKLPDYSKNVTIAECPALKTVDVLATPYVTSHDWIAIEHCPSLERVAFHEMPESAMTGGEPDKYYLPMTVGEETGQFTVYGREEHTALKAWCEEHHYAFEPISDALTLGDVNGDTVANASDAALVLIAASMFGATGTSDLTAEQEKAADVNGDSFINASDAAIIKQYAAAIGAGTFSGSLEQYLKKS